MLISNSMNLTSTSISRKRISAFSFARLRTEGVKRCLVNGVLGMPEMESDGDGDDEKGSESRGRGECE